MSKSSNRPFFVYGTLLPEQPNYYVWGEAIVFEEEGVLANGRLYDMGYYPMLIEEGDEPVTGMIVNVAETEYEAVLERLDHLEGYDPAQPEMCAYRRMLREVSGVNGRIVAAWVYIGQPRYAADKTIVPGGDWLAYVMAMAKDSHNWWTNVKSVSGLLD
jgi:gamma-glutamylcyclotransferase (GGCT)/AIG2-like uncharacterized protein YtfP